MPEPTVPALPAVAAFEDMDMPEALLKTLAAQGVTEPFPIQAATLPNSLAGRDLLGLSLICWPVPPAAGRSRRRRSRWSSYRPVSSRSR